MNGTFELQEVVKGNGFLNLCSDFVLGGYLPLIFWEGWTCLDTLYALLVDEDFHLLALLNF